VRALVAVVLLIACKRADVARPDPTPPMDAKVAPPVVTTSRLSLHGRIVDAANGEVKHALRDTLPWDELNDARAAYVLDKDAMLRAWDVSNGKPLWSISTPARSLDADNEFIYLAEGTNLAQVNKVSGVPKRLATSASIEELRPFAGHLAARHGSTIDVYDRRLDLKGTVTVSGLDRFINDYRVAIVATDASACFVSFTPPDFDVRCIDTNAKETIHAIVPIATGAGRLGAIASTPHHVVIGTYSFGSKTPRAAVIVRLRDGKEVARIGDEIVSIVETPSGDLEGAISVGEEVRFYQPGGALRWKYKPKWPESFAKVLARENTLVVAMHNIIATGVEVFALRKTDGAEMWIGETKLPPIGHSKYHNHVTLESLGDAVILRGHESSVEHVHVYDLTTGKLRYHDP
jgi:hypothetical protein